MASTAGSFASASLYVGDLAPDVTETLLYETFNAVGPVASVRVCRDALTRRSLGYAYVNYHSVEHAERALDTLNFKLIKNKPCRIMWCNRDPSLRRSGMGNIFVHGLHKSIDNKQLFDTFSIFGNILSCKVATNGKGESLGYAFVHFETEEAAVSAIEKVNGKMIHDQVVTVERFKSKRERGSGANAYTNVFIKNLPGNATKEQVEALFKPHGTITSSFISADPAKDRAFGFINFKEPAQAQAAVDALNNTEQMGRTLFVGKAQKKADRERELRQRAEQLKQERAKKYQGINLYVKNLSENVDDEKLRVLFAPFGSIHSARVMTDEKTKASRGFGFVCFTTQEEATRAVTEMNNKMIDGKPLYVALHQRKEQRRAFIEAQRQQQMRAGFAPQMMPMPYQGAPMMMPFGGPRGMMGYPQFRGMPMRGPVGLIPAQARPFPGPNGPMSGYPQQPFNGQQRRGGPSRSGPRLQGQQQPAPSAYRQGPAPAGQQPAIKYGENVRNAAAPRPAMPVAPAQPAAAPAKVTPLGPNEPLTSEALASAPPEVQKQMIGERLFPLIRSQQPELAGKITGMLLEMDNGELLHLLESQAALNEKIGEALEVLNSSTAM